MLHILGDLRGEKLPFNILHTKVDEFPWNCFLPQGGGSTDRFDFPPSVSSCRSSS